jgi:hypothetical protein
MDDLLDFIDQHSNLRPLRPPDFGLTAREYRERKGGKISLSTAGRLLETLVADGLLERREMLVSGRIANVYARKEDWDKVV